MTKLEAEAESADGHVKEVFSISFLERASRCQWANDGVKKKKSRRWGRYTCTETALKSSSGFFSPGGGGEGGVGLLIIITRPSHCRKLLTRIRVRLEKPSSTLVNPEITQELVTYLPEVTRALSPLPQHFPRRRR